MSNKCYARWSGQTLVEPSQEKMKGNILVSHPSCDTVQFLFNFLNLNRSISNHFLLLLFSIYARLLGLSNAKRPSLLFYILFDATILIDQSIKNGLLSWCCASLIVCVCVQVDRKHITKASNDQKCQLMGHTLIVRQQAR